MPPQPQRSGRRPAAKPPEAQPGTEATDQGLSQTPANLLDQLRSERGPTRGSRDIIPIPVLVGVFVAVLLLVVYLLAPGWTDEFKTYRARASQRKGDFGAAVTPLKALTAKYPDSITYLLELGLAYHHTGQYDLALEYLLKAQALAEQAKEVDDDGRPLSRADYQTSIGAAYFEAGDLANAEKYLLGALKRNRLDKYANMNLGKLEFGRKNYRKAMDYFKVVAQDPELRDIVREYYDKIEDEVFAEVK